MLTFHCQPAAVTVHAEVDIQGQMFDWKKTTAASHNCSTASLRAFKGRQINKLRDVRAAARLNSSDS